MRLMIELNPTSNKKTAGIKKCDVCGKEEHLMAPRRWDICLCCERTQGYKAGRRVHINRVKTQSYVSYCITCGKPFEIRTRGVKTATCSKECYIKSLYTMNKTCECGKPIKNGSKTGMCDKCRELKWITENKQHVKKCQTVRHLNRLKTDLQYRLTCSIRCRLIDAIKSGQKAGSAIKHLGCSIEFLKLHLESKFYPNHETGEQMTWKNWSLHGWHIDHIYPLSKLDLTEIEDFKKACNYTNLQPLWATENRKKHSKIMGGING